MLGGIIGYPPSVLRGLIAEPWEHYHSFPIRKSSGSPRLIDAPNSTLKAVQRAILRRVLDDIPRNPASHCRRGYSVVSNARVHIGNPYVSKYDLRDAFPSVSWQAVRGALGRSRIPAPLVIPITSLCTFGGRLPQGPPTSPALLDLVLRRLDDEIEQHADHHGVKYSRYVDDLCISGNRPVRFFSRIVRDAVSRRGFHLAANKTQHWEPGRRATITGILLAKSPSLRPDYLARVRSLVGLLEADRSQFTPSQLSTLRGQVSWIAQVHTQSGARLRARFEAAIR